MKTTKKVIFSSVLAVIMLAVSVLLCLQGFSFSGVNTLTKGAYNDSFTAFAEEGETQAVAEIAETKYMLSVNEDYLLLATALHIENTDEYTEIGYIVTKDGKAVEDAGLSSSTYYTGITVQTTAEPKTWEKEEIFTEDTEAMGMIVAEIKYNTAYEYTIQPYVIKKDVAQPILGTEYIVAAYGHIGYNFMSFNIRTIATETNAINNWDNRKAAVVDFMNNSDADVIGLQEVRQTQFTYIEANLASNYDALYFPRESGTNPEGLAFVYDKTAFDVVSSEKYWLSETPDTQSKGWGESYYRIAAVLLLQHKATGEYVKAINTHGPLVDEACLNAYNLIMERSVTDDCFTFLCGDFNATPDSDPYNAVATELQDCRVTAATSANRDHITHTGWGTYVDGETPNHIIDYCFVSKGKNVEVLTYTVRTDKWGDNNTNYLSDHYAVQTTVRVRYRLQPSIKLPITSENGFDGKLDVNLT